MPTARTVDVLKTYRTAPNGAGGFRVPQHFIGRVRFSMLMADGSEEAFANRLWVSNTRFRIFSTVHSDIEEARYPKRSPKGKKNTNAVEVT